MAERLLLSLPGVLMDEDDGVDEALRRDREMDADRRKVLSHDEFLKSFRNRRG
jgi:hypothetical protein